MPVTGSLQERTICDRFHSQAVISSSSAELLQSPDVVRGKRIVSDASIDSFHSATEFSPGSVDIPSRSNTPQTGWHRTEETHLSPAPYTLHPQGSSPGSGSTTETLFRGESYERSTSITQLESPTLTRNHYHRGNMVNSPRPISACFDEPLAFDPTDPDMWHLSRIINWLESNSFGKEWQDSITEHKIQHSDVRTFACTACNCILTSAVSSAYIVCQGEANNASWISRH